MDIERRRKMVNLPQNPILFGDGLWLYNKDEKVSKNRVKKSKRNLAKKTPKKILLLSFKL